MLMKQIFTLGIACVAAMAFFASCDESRLDIPQKGVVNIEAFYKTDADAESALVSAYANMVKGNKYTDNKELLLIPGASHVDLYDGGEKKVIPFDKLEAFYNQYLK